MDRVVSGSLSRKVLIISPIPTSYHIHSDVGDCCSGARVNEKLIPLEHKLVSGDVVEIITDKNRKAPSEDWLKFVKTHVARAHIKHRLKRQRSTLAKLFRRGQAT